MEKGSFGKASFGKAFEDGIVKGLGKEVQFEEAIAKVPEKMTVRLGFELGVVTGKTAKALDVLQFFSGPK